MSVSTQTAISLPADKLSSLDSKFANRTANVGIIGLGYVGLPLALLFTDADFPVTGFDVDAQKVEKLSRGESYIYRLPSSEVQLARMKQFSATVEFSDIARMDAVIICVPTPLNEQREPDLSFVMNTAEAITPHLQAGQLIVLESTSYPGTTEEVLVPILEKNARGLRAQRDGNGVERESFYVAFSPEREDPGNNTIARRDIPKIVGGLNNRATELAATLYQAIFQRIVPVSTPAIAEMTKLLENIYRCVNIALVNELKLLCLRMGIDVWEVIDAASTKPFGFQPFYPGPGLGGHCIPVDPFYLSWKAKQWDFQTRFIELAGEINVSMPYHVVSTISEALNRTRKPLNGSRVLILGVSYKKDVDDLRESPALTIIDLLRQQGAIVSYNDPYFPVLLKGRHYDLQMERVPLDNIGEYDCVAIITDHSDYEYPAIVREAQLVVDTRNATRGIDSSKIVRC
ncbi:MAG: nucleotide sugar dehydrogenase [Acidobacteria bacterium]|nr:MAG: nucleotide sugar dehydrogenase [Acidobacteriota bacterium]